MYIQQSHNTENATFWSLWIKRLGWLCLLALFVKGTVWATLPLLLVFVGA